MEQSSASGPIQQPRTKHVMPISKRESRRTKPQEITPEMRDFKAYSVLRIARTKAKHFKGSAAQKPEESEAQPEAE